MVPCFTQLKQKLDLAFFSNVYLIFLYFFLLFLIVFSHYCIWNTTLIFFHCCYHISYWENMPLSFYVYFFISYCHHSSWWSVLSITNYPVPVPIPYVSHCPFCGFLLYHGYHVLYWFLNLLKAGFFKKYIACYL